MVEDPPQVSVLRAMATRTKLTKNKTANRCITYGSLKSCANLSLCACLIMFISKQPVFWFMGKAQDCTAFPGLIAILVA